LEGKARWGVGQLADRLTVNQEVAGSSPAAPALVSQSPARSYERPGFDFMADVWCLAITQQSRDTSSPSPTAVARTVGSLKPRARILSTRDDASGLSVISEELRHCSLRAPTSSLRNVVILDLMLNDHRGDAEVACEARDIIVSHKRTRD
jgi:hypothetical protein